MKSLAVVAALWQCFALNPDTGRLYSAKGETKKQAQNWALNRCEANGNPGDLTTCFLHHCKALTAPTPAPSPTPACTCNPSHTQCTCTIDPNDPGSEMWMQK